MITSAVASPVLDLTGIATSIIGAVLTLVVSAFLAWLQAHMKDQAAAATLGAAVRNAVGAVEQAAVAGMQTHPLLLKLPAGTPAPAAAGVQYVLDNAGPELARFSGITLADVTAKVQAQVGLAKLGSPASTIVVPATMAQGYITSPGSVPGSVSWCGKVIG